LDPPVLGRAGRAWRGRLRHVQAPPWAAALLIRNAFGKDAAARSRALERHLPGKVAELRGQR